MIVVVEQAQLVRKWTVLILIAYAWLLGYEWLAGGCVCLLLGWVFYPVYSSAGVSTLPYYMELRFRSRRIRVHLTLISLFLYLFAKTSVTLWAGAIVLQTVLGLPFLLSATLLVSGTGAYAIAGGLSAVIYTEVFQTVTLLAGAFALMGISYARVCLHISKIMKPLSPRLFIFLQYLICCKFHLWKVIYRRQAERSDTVSIFAFFEIGWWPQLPPG